MGTNVITGNAKRAVIKTANNMLEKLSYTTNGKPKSSFEKGI